MLLDSGVRRGTDVVKALALGAKAVLIGRPYLYGLAVEGQAGIEKVLEIFRAEIERTLLLMGVRVGARSQPGASVCRAAGAATIRTIPPRASPRRCAAHARGGLSMAGRRCPIATMPRDGLAVGALPGFDAQLVTTARHGRRRASAWPARR